MSAGTAAAEASERSPYERYRARFDGNLSLVRCRPVGTSTAVEAMLDDGSEVIRLVWMGQQRITGIEPGRTLAVEGMLGVHRGRKTIFNPRYQLIPDQPASC
ncbi:MAG TPA: OB-fold nucleic acid binding domain-containing protein [Streptosporangiaceae bacterium]|jgi:hypothetical protein